MKNQTLVALLITPIAVFLTFFFHELAHWTMGEILGYKMTMLINSSDLVDGGGYKYEWHDHLIDIIGPLFTVCQGLAFYLLLNRKDNKIVFPFLLVSFIMRLGAGIINYRNLNDEGRVSVYLGLNTYAISVVICSILFYWVYKIAQKYHYSWLYLTLLSAAIIGCIMGLTHWDSMYKIRIL
jgi:hypothetical protein